jgi:hypothetical protein
VQTGEFFNDGEEGLGSIFSVSGGLGGGEKLVGEAGGGK